MIGTSTTSGWLRPLLGGILVIAGAAYPPPAAAQETGTAADDEPAAVEETIEWNFRRTPVATPRTDVSLRERWETPFAVMSSGTAARREPRRVALPDLDEVARLTAAIAADSGETVARVTVDGGGERVTVAQATAAEPEDADATATAGEDGAEEEEDGVDGEGSDSASASAASDEDAEADDGDDAGAADEADPEASGSSAAPMRVAATHEVRYGETWYALARQYRVSSRELAAANPDVDPERLRAGTVLRIPPAAGARAAPRTHTVTRGDTLFGIARRYGVSADALRAANRLSDDVVRLGQTLVIPREETTR